MRSASVEARTSSVSTVSWSLSAWAVPNELVEHVRDALDEAGDTGTVTELLAEVLARGNGAAFQRNAYQDAGMSRMIDNAVSVTAR